MLFNSVTLEVAIGLFFVFLIVSLLCSELNEIIAAVVNLRAKFLHKGITGLFNENEKLVRDFYESPLIKGLSQPQTGPGRLLARAESSPPSYIPSYVFSRVLRDIIVPDSGTLPPRSWHDVLSLLLARLSQQGSQLSPLEREVIGAVQTAGIDAAKLESLKNLTDELKAARAALHEIATRDSARDTAAGQLLMEKVRLLERSVQETEADVNGALERAQANVERYFDFAMERVSGWYKRRVQAILLALAILVTSLFNIDTFGIIENLMAAPVTRAALIEQATAQVQASGEDQSSAVSQLNEMSELGLELGWNACTLPGFAVQAPSAANCAQSVQARSTPGWMLAKLGGLATTVAAVSLGAPFWFDLLNKIVNLRLSGQKPSAQRPEDD